MTQQTFRKHKPHIRSFDNLAAFNMNILVYTCLNLSYNRHLKLFFQLNDNLQMV